MAQVPCFLCSQQLQQRKDKHNKPYFVCDPCGVQIFVRGRQGIKNLADLIATLSEHDFPFHEHAEILYEIQAVLTEIRGIEKEIKKLDRFDMIFADDEYKRRARVVLCQRVELLLGRLQQIANDEL